MIARRYHDTDDSPPITCLVWILVGVVGCGTLQPPPDRPESQIDTSASSEASPTRAKCDVAPDVNSASTFSDTRDAPSKTSPDPEEAERRLLKRATARMETAHQESRESSASWANRHLPTRYPNDRALSPLTPHVVEHLKTIARRAPEARDDVFAKVGGSNTVNPNFMECFAGDDVELDGRSHLQPTIDVFANEGEEAPNSYLRESKATKVGWTAMHVMKGQPAPLIREIRASQPRFAIIMYGTNDIGWRSLDTYAEDMFRIVDALTERGVIPILTAIPPREDEAEAARQVPRFNDVLRGIAQRRQLPFVDLNHRLRQLPDQGLGGDGLHMTALAGAQFQPCIFTEEGMKHGHNNRNLLTIEMLHRLRQVLVEGASAPDALHHPSSPESGTVSDPIALDRLPTATGGDTSKMGDTQFDRYPGCESNHDESGPEIIYKLTLSETTKLRASVVDRRGVDLDLHLLEGETTPSACRARGDHTVTATLPAGTHYLVVDTFDADEKEIRPGEFVLTVRDEPVERSMLSRDSRPVSTSRPTRRARMQPVVRSPDERLHKAPLVP